MPIAFDSKLEFTGTPAGTSHSVSFTNTAGNMVLFWVWIADATTTVSSPQYAGAAATAHTSNPFTVATNERVHAFFVTSAATGANNITYTTSASVATDVWAGSYSGTLTTGQPDAQGTGIDNTGGANPINYTLTVNTANAWLITGERDTNASVTGVGANTVRRTTSTGFTLADGGPFATGSRTISITHSNVNGGGLVFSIKPSATTIYSRLSMMSIGT